MLGISLFFVVLFVVENANFLIHYIMYIDCAYCLTINFISVVWNHMWLSPKKIYNLFLYKKIIKSI